MDADEIAHQSTNWCKKWWKECGKQVPKGTRIASLRQQIVEWHEYLQESDNNKLVISTGETLTRTSRSH